MKIFLLFVFCYCFGDSEASENYWGGYEIPDYTGYERHHDHPEKPCSTHDIDCIRSFFVHNVGCFPTHRPVSDPYIVKQIPLQLPHCNMTVLLIDVQIKGIRSGKINEFFIDKESDTLVLEVVFDDLVVYTPHTVAIYRRKGKAPLHSSADSRVEFKDLSLTLTIENFRDPHKSKKHVFAYFSDAHPPYYIGDGISKTTDPLRLRMNEKWMRQMILSAQEGYLTQGPVYMAAFLRHFICDLELD